MRHESATAIDIECGVRQLLADKISGTMVGLWLLIPEYLRLGVWDLLRSWTHSFTPQVAPRLALQMVNEAALCISGVRQQRCLSQKGFEVANGLPFVATDRQMHLLLNAHTVAETQQLQIALGHIRRASGHFNAQLLAIDPHRMPSHSKRQMPRHRPKPELPATKHSQGFFCLDVETFQPVCFTLGSSSRTVSQATPELLQLTDSILQPQPGSALVMADSEHFSADLLCSLKQQSPFDLLVPMPNQPYYHRQIHQLPENAFSHHWAGMATAKIPFQFAKNTDQSFWRFIQRTGERSDQYRFKSFLSSADRDEVDALTLHYPDRWHVEEFFNLNQDLGWKKAGTMNLNIRYGRMTLALIAQAAIHQLRHKLDEPFSRWSADHFARSLFKGLDGDVRVRDDTIIVTYYNAPNAEQLHPLYHNFSTKLENEGLDPRIPWLYDFKLDFRFK